MHKEYNPFKSVKSFKNRKGSIKVSNVSSPKTSLPTDLGIRPESSIVEILSVISSSDNTGTIESNLNLYSDGKT